MPDWQWTRIEELQQYRQYFKDDTMYGFPRTVDQYYAWIDDMLAKAPRRWEGFTSAEDTAKVMQYRAALPEPVIEHWKRYWRAWLVPDKPIDQLVQGYIGNQAAAAYYRQTGDWRGWLGCCGWGCVG